MTRFTSSIPLSPLSKDCSFASSFVFKMWKKKKNKIRSNGRNTDLKKFNMCLIKTNKLSTLKNICIIFVCTSTLKTLKMKSVGLNIKRAFLSIKTKKEVNMIHTFYHHLTFKFYLEKWKYFTLFLIVSC